jgi:hypothetical protein
MKTKTIDDPKAQFLLLAAFEITLPLFPIIDQLERSRKAPFPVNPARL